MDREAWRATIHGVAKSWTRLSDQTELNWTHGGEALLITWATLYRIPEMEWTALTDLEKAMVTHSNTLAWKIPGTEEPGGLPSMGSHKVGHDWSDLVAAAAAALTESSPKGIHYNINLLNSNSSRCWRRQSLTNNLYLSKSFIFLFKSFLTLPRSICSHRDQKTHLMQ